MSSPLPKYFPNLTPLRGLAALAVVLFHKVTIYSGIEPESGGIDKLLDAVFSKGNLGVNFFFTLSGFLITYLLIGEKQNNGNFDIFNFLVRRILRIWPVYFVVVLFGFLIYPYLTGTTSDHDLFYFVTFLSNFDEIINGAGMSVHNLTVLWSVSIEEQFYIGWAIILGVFALYPRKHFPPFFILVIITSITFRLAFIDDPRIIYYHTLSVISDMALGGLLAHSVIFRNPYLNLIKNMRRSMILLIYVVGIMYCLTHNTFMKGDLYAFDRLITGLFWCFVIAEQCFANHSFLKLGKFVVLQYLGKISYGIYAYHLIVFFFINQMVGYDWIGGGWFVDLILNTIIIVLLTVGVSALSYQFMEAPLLKLKERFRQ